MITTSFIPALHPSQSIETSVKVDGEWKAGISLVIAMRLNGRFTFEGE